MRDRMSRRRRLDEALDNPCTCIVDVPRSAERPSIRQTFIERYGSVRQLCERQPRGLTVIAVGPGGLISARLEASVSRTRALIIGRHYRCRFRLRGDMSVSLRHVAVLLAPADATNDLRFRVLDLATPTALLDEYGRHLESLESESPVFLRCGAHVLMFLPTGDDIAWPDDPVAGWECIPERVYFDECTADLDARRAVAQEGQLPRPEAMPAAAGVGRNPGVSPGVSIVTRLPGPAFAAPELDEEDVPLGYLAMRTPFGGASFPVGVATARRGLLLGRYRRCESNSQRLLCDLVFSRVHVLLVDIGGQLWALDTASTCGMYLDVEGNPKVAVHRLERDLPLYLAHFVARLNWVPVECNRVQAAS